jgi:hypothetical protein
MSQASFPSIAGPNSGFIPGVFGKTKVKGSHAIEEDGERHVLVKNVELFSEVDGGPLGRVDHATIEKIVQATNANYARGRHVGVILTHSDNAEVVGRVSSPVRCGRCERTGKYTIYGDMRMARSDFESLLYNGRYPRRSAEIGKTSLAMHNVSLLGRESPAADIRDVVFAAEREATTHTTEPVACYALGESSSIRFNEEHPMTTAELISTLTAAFSSMSAAERAAAESQIRAAVGGESDARFSEVNDRLAMFETRLAEATATRDVLQVQVCDLTAQLAESNARFSDSETARVRDRHRERLVHFKTNLGFVMDVDRELKAVMALPEAERDAHFSYIASTYRREGTGPGIIARGALPFEAISNGQGNPAGGAAQMTSDDRDAIQKFAGDNNIVNFAEAKAKWMESRGVACSK